MRAPVYRSLEARNTVLGLTFPTEFTLVLASWWAGMITVGTAVGSAIALATYVIVRVANYGRAEGFVQHLLQFKLRRAVSGGRLGAAARVGASRAPRFPHAAYGYAGDDLGRRLNALIGGLGGERP